MVAGPRTKVLIAGGGVAGLEAVIALRSVDSERFDMELMAPQRYITRRSLASGPPFLRATAERMELAAMAAEHDVRLTRDGARAGRPRPPRSAHAGWSARSYDVLVLALGTRPAVSVAGAMAFRGLQDLGALIAALDAVPSVAYIAASTSMWTAPLYELAVQTTAWAADRRKALDVLVVTAERVDDSLANRLVTARATVFPETVVDRFADDHLELADGRRVKVGLAVALPHLTGPIVRGLPARSRAATLTIPTCSYITHPHTPTSTAELPRGCDHGERGLSSRACLTPRTSPPRSTSSSPTTTKSSEPACDCCSKAKWVCT